MSAVRLRVAIVGAGPAGLYAAGHLLDQTDYEIKVDIFDRLPTPFGLVRAGVAPDHPEKKQVIDRLFDFYLSHPHVRFFGNVEFGTHVTIDDLGDWYDAVIFAVGANNDVKLGLPGETLTGSHSAREFVAWYNGHPDFSAQIFDLSCNRAVIIGNGNVAIDVARMLTLSPEALGKTEIANQAAQALTNSKIEEVVILGRRSHEFAAYNTPELEELEHLDGVDIRVEGAVFETNSVEQGWLAKRKIEILKRLAGRPLTGAAKTIVLRFLASPVAVLGDDRVSGLKVANTRMQPDAAGNWRPIADGTESIFETGLVLRSVGYRGGALPGLPFDPEKGVIPNALGRVLENGSTVPSVFVTGWIKRGPRGVIGTNKKCAQETVKCLIDDMSNLLGRQARLPGPEIEARLRLRNPDLVTLTGWGRIDRSERLKGAQQGRPRVKHVSWGQLLSTAAQETTTV